MGADPPFLYDHPSRYSFTGPTEKGFNPKAASHASWTPRPAPQKRDGPLINSKELNRHPDSYFIVYGRPPMLEVLDWKPLSRNTKDKVNWTRRVLRLFRVCALLGAAGLLVCVICIKGTDSTLGWIIRIAPGLAILHTVYAIYHLMRSSKDRTPSSSASYMLFAAIIDAGLIPFFVFTAMMARAQYTEPNDTAGHWGTLFGDDSDTFKIIFSAFLLSVVGGGLLLISLFLSVYLAVMFRKIAKLPPDMNPLEDNLTSRHKRNKSSISAPLIEVTNREKHLSAPLMDTPRAVPFLHTRTESSDSQTPHRRPGNSNRSSKVDLSMYQQPSSNRSSRANLSVPNDTSPQHAPSIPYQKPISNRSSRTNFSRPLEPSTQPTAPNTHTHRSQTRPLSVPSPSSSSKSSNASNNSNWTTHPSPPELQHLRNIHPNPSAPPPKIYNFTTMTPRPLEMNPPTPPISTGGRALHPVSGNAAWHDDPARRPRPHHARGDSFGVVGDKARYYGALHAGKGRVGGGSGSDGGSGNGGGGGNGSGGSDAGKGSRVMSSGSRVGGDWMGIGKGLGMGLRGRGVSGKVAEEGRANCQF
ncbi:hypothetical protein MMC15_005957 [Xylographa vitiligo]|nr:hypothetical protein [Xylographa vitiligo]